MKEVPTGLLTGSSFTTPNHASTCKFLMCTCSSINPSNCNGFLFAVSECRTFQCYMEFRPDGSTINFKIRFGPVSTSKRNTVGVRISRGIPMVPLTLYVFALFTAISASSSMGISSMFITSSDNGYSPNSLFAATGNVRTRTTLLAGVYWLQSAPSGLPPSLLF